MEAGMLTRRTETILKSIINWYIEHAVPVSSQALVHDYDLGVSSATVRNEMASLEEEGYIIRPHTSAGSVPSDKGYRFYVASLDEIALPVAEQRMIRHLFHQVEGRMDEWLSLAASIVARLSQNTAVITVPKPADCRFRRMEMVSVQDNLVLLVLVLRGVRIKQELLSLENPIPQVELNTISEKMNQAYVGFSGAQIKAKDISLSPLEKQMIDSLVKMMDTEDEQGYNQSYLEGLHFMLNQPEFSHNQRIMAILDLLEHRAMLGSILPAEQSSAQIRVVIGTENKAEVARDCSLVISRYGLPEEAVGSILVVGPTRMPYPRVISAVSYLSALLSGLVAELYGVNAYSKLDRDSKN
jgi:heat-inducible transcriptional repressor